MGALAQTYTYTSSSGGGVPIVLVIFSLALAVFEIAAMWVVFKKAGKPGWAAIVPIYNILVELEIIGRPLWWIILYFVPIVNIVIGIIILLDLAKSFGKSTAFALGLIFLGVIFFPILAWGSATYRGPAAAVAGMPAAPPPPAPPAPPAGGSTS